MGYVLHGGLGMSRVLSRVYLLVGGGGGLLERTPQYSGHLWRPAIRGGWDRRRGAYGLYGRAKGLEYLFGGTPDH